MIQLQNLVSSTGYRPNRRVDKFPAYIGPTNHPDRGYPYLICTTAGGVVTQIPGLLVVLNSGIAP